MTPITDEQLREACDRLAFNPLGTLEADSEERVPEPGPLGFAVGHPSPGWKWLRGLVDHVTVALEGDRFDSIDPDTIDDFYKEQAALRASSLFAGEALVIVADIEVTGTANTDQAEYAQSSMLTRDEFTHVAYDLVEYAGFMVCREVFTDHINHKKGTQ